jgi:hypothetical protein
MKGFDIKTQEDVDAYYRRHGWAPPRSVIGSLQPEAPRDLAGVLARVRPSAPPAPRPRRKISKTEERYAPLLDVAQHEGYIKAWWHHPLKLWIAPAMSYEPDYLTQLTGPDVLTFLASQPITLSPTFAESLCRFGAYGLTCIEVKYSWMFDRRRALDRLKTAVSLYPMLRFRLATWDRQQQRFLEQEVPAL